MLYSKNFITIGGNMVTELQRKLVEEMGSISLGSSNTRALEIVNQLGKDHINDTIVTLDGRQFTALDCAIMFDSQGNNPRINERPRINNSAFRELESAIRSAGGRTSEELGLIQNIFYGQDEFYRIAMDSMERAREEINRRPRREITRELAHCALFAGSSYLAYTSRNDEGFSMSRYLIGMIGMGAFMMLKAVECRNLFRALTRGEQERQVPTNLENTTDVQSNIGERQPILG
ncbi:MAG: hypothetical protein ACEY3M_12290 [Wolbachia sp.]